jgi:hypothetical protein
MGYLE